MRTLKVLFLSVIAGLFLTATALVAKDPPPGDPAPAPAEAAPADKPVEQKGPEVIQMTLHPAATPRPALKYRLLPDAVDLKPGDAATLYMIAAKVGPDLEKAEQLLYAEGATDYVDTPMDQLAPEDVRRVLEPFGEMLSYADLAARRERADWDAGLRERGFHALLPYLHDARMLANVLGLQARFQVSQGDWAGAERTFQTGFALARHLDESPVLVQALVATGVRGALLHRGVETWIGQEGSPNLYWALSSLPNPVADFSAVAAWEQAWLAFEDPLIGQAMSGGLPDEQWPQVLQGILRLSDLGKPMDETPPAQSLEERAAEWVQIAAPRARAYLVEVGGYTRDEVDAMSAEQAVGTYALDEYQVESDEAWKVWALPYWQAEPHLRRVEEARLRREGDDQGLNPMTQWLIASTSRARFQMALIDRRVAALRLVEALRDHAARHDGLPPQSLDELTDLPMPVDPFTDEPFAYWADGRTAVIEAPGAPMRGRGWRFELTFAE